MLKHFFKRDNFEKDVGFYTETEFSVCELTGSRPQTDRCVFMSAQYRLCAHKHTSVWQTDINHADRLTDGLSVTVLQSSKASHLLHSTVQERWTEGAI